MIDQKLVLRETAYGTLPGGLVELCEVVKDGYGVLVEQTDSCSRNRLNVPRALVGFVENLQIKVVERWNKVIDTYLVFVCNALKYCDGYLTLEPYLGGFVLGDPHGV